MIIGQQFVENVNAEIACGTRQEHVADGLTLAIAESVEGVFVQNRNEGGVFGIINRCLLLLEGI